MNTRSRACLPTRPKPHTLVAAVLAVFTFALLFATASLALPGCRWEKRDVPPALAGDPIKVGLPLPLTGAQAAFGETKRNAYEMAAEEINAAGGVDGRPLVLVLKDTGGEPDTAASVAQELIRVDKVTLLAGEYSSACSLAVAEVAQRYAIPYLVDSATADEVTEQEWQYVFRLTPPAGLFAQSLCGFFREVVKPRSMAIVYERSEYGSSVARAMRSWCRETGVHVTVDESYEPGLLGFTAVISQLKEAKPDVVYLASYLDASPIVRQARAQGLSPKLLAGGAGGFVLPDFVAKGGQAVENVVTAALWSPVVEFPGAGEFAETYKARYGDYPTYHSAEAYACICVIDDALRRAASTDPERLRAALVDTELVTVLGPVRFEKFGKHLNQNRGSTMVLQILGGKYEVIWPPECATAQCVFPDPAWAGTAQTGP